MAFRTFEMISRQDGGRSTTGRDPFPCKICGSTTLQLGTRTGSYRKELFRFRRCDNCRFTFVENPWTDYQAIYSEEYYSGRGADPLIDYAFDLSSPDSTAHVYEWRGVLSAVKSLVAITSATRWLDFGCGAGGLVGHLRNAGVNAIGLEDGAIADRARSCGVPVMRSTEIPEHRGEFDVITAIEVLEHVESPLSVLRDIRSLLKPGGVFFYTTGNAKPFRENFLNWRYVVPEIHISYFEPGTLEFALRKCGFRPEWRGYLPGFTDILRYKILKNVGVKRRSVFERILPWPALARAAQLRYKVLAHPVGWAE